MASDGKREQGVSVFRAIVSRSGRRVSYGLGLEDTARCRGGRRPTVTGYDTAGWGDLLACAGGAAAALAAICVGLSVDMSTLLRPTRSGDRTSSPGGRSPRRDAEHPGDLHRHAHASHLQGGAGRFRLLSAAARHSPVRALRAASREERRSPTMLQRIVFAFALTLCLLVCGITLAAATEAACSGSRPLSSAPASWRRELLGALVEVRAASRGTATTGPWERREGDHRARYDLGPRPGVLSSDPGVVEAAPTATAPAFIRCALCFQPGARALCFQPAARALCFQVAARARVTWCTRTRSPRRPLSARRWPRVGAGSGRN